MTVPAFSPAADPRATLAKAVTRAAGLLGISQAELAQILGVSPATVSRLVAGRYLPAPARKEWELGVLFVRLFRSLDALVGHGEAVRTWLRGTNTALGDAPANLIRSAEGLVRVVHYLDAARGET